MSVNRNQKWGALGALALALLVVGLDATVLSVALPTLATSLKASEQELQWFVASYSLAMVAMLLPAGLLGDRYGRKKLLIGALVVFGAASLAAAYATSSEAFIAARTALGLSAAFLIPLSLAVIPVLFTEEERPRAVGVWAAANFLALPIGPILGGWLLTQFWWGSVFLINIPVVILALVAVGRFVPESRSEKKPGLDPAGVIASSAGLGLLVYGVIEAGENGWLDAGALAFVLSGLAVLVGFVLWEARLRVLPGGQPLVDIGLFSSPSFTWGTILAGLGVFAMFGVLFAAPQYFTAILGTNAEGSGFRLLPTIAGFVFAALFAERLGTWIGPKLATAAGFAALAGGLFLGAATTVASGDWFVVGWTFLAGAGMGVALVTASNGALGALSPDRAGVGSALIQTVNKVGGPFGAAILGSVLNSVYRSNLNLSGLPARAAEAAKDSVFAGTAVAHQIGSAALLTSVRTSFVDALDVALWVSGGVAVAAMALALIFLPGRVPAAHAEAATGAAAPEGLELEHEHATGG